jgi:hypothetical protein
MLKRGIVHSPILNFRNIKWHKVNASIRECFFYGRPCFIVARGKRNTNISLCRIDPIRPNRTSPPTPMATSAFANDDAHCSKKESYGGWITASATSATIPMTSTKALHNAARSHDSTAASNSCSEAFISPFFRRHPGKGFRWFWFGGSGGVAGFFAILYLTGAYTPLGNIPKWAGTSIDERRLTAPALRATSPFEWGGSKALVRWRGTSHIWESQGVVDECRVG